jgi:hypothetical protein
LISFIGFVGVKLAIIAVAVGIALLTENYIGKFGDAVGWIVGLFVGGLLFAGLQTLNPYLERLEHYTNTYKRYPFTEKFGKGFPEPKPEDFGITGAEFNDYNSRFQFEYIKMIVSYVPLIVVLIFVFNDRIKGSLGILSLGGAVMSVILLNSLFNYLNKKISQKHRYYEKIHQYQQALNIYFKIRDENSKF